MSIAENVYERYIAAGGRRSFVELFDPMTGLVSLALVDGKLMVASWDARLDDIGVAQPSASDLKAAEAALRSRVHTDPDAELFLAAAEKRRGNARK
jgi:hypothetical protein